MPAGTRSSDAVSNALLVLGGNGPTPPEYKRPFSQKNSLRFHQEYLEYERKVTLSNLGQSVQRQVLKRTQLLPNSVRATLSRIYFRNAHGRELEEDDLLEALTKHAECWAEAQIDPHVACTEVSRIVTMGKQSTAVDRIDAVYHKLAVYFENPKSKALFCETSGAFKKGPAQVITKNLVAGLTPPEFKKKVESVLAMRGHWKDDPELVFDLVREAATEWRTVEQFERDRGSHRGGAAEKAAPSSSARKKQKSTPGQLTCWTCGEAGHRSGDCPTGGGSASGANTGSGKSQSRGHPNPKTRAPSLLAGVRSSGTPRHLRLLVLRRSVSLWRVVLRRRPRATQRRAAMILGLCRLPLCRRTARPWPTVQRLQLRHGGGFPLEVRIACFKSSLTRMPTTGRARWICPSRGRRVPTCVPL